jgi:STE24 endopeptidase
LVLGTPFVWAFLKVVLWAGDSFVLWALLLMAGFQMIVLLILPTLQGGFPFSYPLHLGFFNKFEPLPDGELKSKIEALATKLKFPLSELFTIDGSKRSSHSNAYFFGIFRKRIVLFDTLLTQCNQEEVMAVLSHEIGHWFVLDLF